MVTAGATCFSVRQFRLAHFFMLRGVGDVKNEKELYQKLYHKMFNEVTDTIENLVKLQQDAEEMYLRYYDEKDEKKRKEEIR